MSTRSTYILGGATSVLVVVSWVIWALIAEAGKWRGFDALSALISGLAFVGLIVTVSIQLAQIRDQGESSASTLSTQKQLATIQALSAIRRFAGARIQHLNDKIDSGQILKTDNMTAAEAENEIVRMRKLIDQIEGELGSVCQTLVPTIEKNPFERDQD